MLYLCSGILIIFWLLGLVLHASSLIHILLVASICMFAVQFFDENYHKLIK